VVANDGHGRTLRDTGFADLGRRVDAMTDFSDMAREIIESNRYMVLGTADASGVPWAAPVWYAHTDHRRFIWVSSPDRRHSRNVEARPEVSIVIFDSSVAVGGARAVYMSARAQELSGAELERDVAVFDSAGQAQGLPRRWTLEDMRAPAPYRLYAATVSQHWVLDPDSSPDDRAEVTL
jgi:Pyridoxamine 5'-phosphate oxidase